MTTGAAHSGRRSARAAPAGAAEDITSALAALGKRRLVLAIHDLSFPGRPGQDTGRGTPYSTTSSEFLSFVAGLGFDGIMLGPQGMTSRENPSPYDGTLFSRNTLNIDYPSLAADSRWAPLLDNLPPFRLGDEGLERARHTAVHDAQAAALGHVHARLRASRQAGEAAGVGIGKRLSAFAGQHAAWLDADALYYALAERNGGRHHRDWPEELERELMSPPGPEGDRRAARARVLRRELAGPIERFVLGQLIVHEQHAAFRQRVHRLGLRLYGDLQVGLSPCDEWSRGHLMLRGYRLGAPPSRTNPSGQPWGYRLLEPGLYEHADGTPGPAVRFLRARIEKLLEECDGLRIDHPHGLVCPWVYCASERDPSAAVQSGARLFSSPDRADHPELTRYAIARPEQLRRDGTVAHYADSWVRDLDEAQLHRYGILLDALIDVVERRGGEIDEVVCEVLSTCPYPLARVLERHRLGRFLVTQKADVRDRDDVYRSENARPEDWIMVGNHDTPPIWKLVREWAGTDTAHDQAAYLASRLCPGRNPEAYATELASAPERLAEAKFADIFASAASHVLVFFSDLLGLDATYNQPGTIHGNNWSLRVPPDYAEHYARSLARGQALNLPRVLALALRARGPGVEATHRALIERLERLG